MSSAADFGTELFDMMVDTNLCLYTAFCCPCSIASNWSIAMDQQCGIIQCLCAQNPYYTRQLIRTRKHMKRDCGYDCLVFTFCQCCAICQDGRELKNGFGKPTKEEYYFGEKENPNSLMPEQQPPQQNYIPPQQNYIPPVQSYEMAKQ